jgi:hypothetical protein
MHSLNKMIVPLLVSLMFSSLSFAQRYTEAKQFSNVIIASQKIVSIGAPAYKFLGRFNPSDNSVQGYACLSYGTCEVHSLGFLVNVSYSYQAAFNPAAIIYYEYFINNVRVKSGYTQLDNKPSSQFRVVQFPTSLKLMNGVHRVDFYGSTNTAVIASQVDSIPWPNISNLVPFLGVSQTASFTQARPERPVVTMSTSNPYDSLSRTVAFSLQTSAREDRSPFSSLETYGFNVISYKVRTVYNAQTKTASLNYFYNTASQFIVPNLEGKLSSAQVTNYALYPHDNYVLQFSASDWLLNSSVPSISPIIKAQPMNGGGLVAAPIVTRSNGNLSVTLVLAPPSTYYGTTKPALRFYGYLAYLKKITAVSPSGAITSVRFQEDMKKSLIYGWVNPRGMSPPPPTEWVVFNFLAVPAGRYQLDFCSIDDQGIEGLCKPLSIEVVDPVPVPPGGDGDYPWTDETCSGCGP